MYLAICRYLAASDVYVLRGDGVNEFIPEKCDMHALRKYNVPWMVGLYKRVIPYKCVPMLCSSSHLLTRID